MFKDLVKLNRSYRRFDSSEDISYDVLTDIIDTARYTPSARNLQVMRFRIVNTKVENDRVFRTLGWAGYLPDWDGPEENERPTAYIVLLRDITLGKTINYDDGIAAQTITLAAVEKGLGCCMIQSCQWKELFDILNINPLKYTFSSIIAIGKPVENIILEDIKEGNVKYYRDEQLSHHVPKRTLAELLIT